MKAITTESAQSNTNPYWRNTTLLRAMLIALAILPAACNKDGQQTNTAQPSSQTPIVQSDQAATITPQAKPLSDLESLVAPIALYPDPLLAELLVASTYPFEVVQAARWLESQPDMATLSSKNWDASIMRLTSVPQVIKIMNAHLDWTTQLGDTFLAKPAEVMASIQALRKRAMDAGYLKDSPEQKVNIQTVAQVQPAVLQKEVISIKPAKADTVYVPQYKPEMVYQAPMAPPPATVVNVNAAAAPSYYPAYYPATTTTSNDAAMNFATGALVGGLLTWGIMEWADNDDYYVGHYYGNSVCHSGNCWHGGGGYYRGGGYYGDRGDVNYNKNINISGNEINVARGGNFSQNSLRASQQPTGWQSDPRHRRGQSYPKAAQQRLGASQALPTSARGFIETGQRPAAAALSAERRPSSADIQRQLAQKPSAQRAQTQNKSSTRHVQSQSVRDNALQGLKTSGQTAKLQSQRGASSRKPAAPGSLTKQAQAQIPRAPRPTQTAARPNAFEAPNTGTTQSFSRRGAASVQRSASAGNFQPSGRSSTAVGTRSAGGGRRR